MTKESIRRFALAVLARAAVALVVDAAVQNRLCGTAGSQLVRDQTGGGLTSGCSRRFRRCPLGEYRASPLSRQRYAGETSIAATGDEARHAGG
jgi:hypothetical protein